MVSKGCDIMPENEKRFTLRINAQLFERIKKQAAINRRSVAKEIEFILFQSLGLDPDPKVQGNGSLMLMVMSTAKKICLKMIPKNNHY